MILFLFLIGMPVAVLASGGAGVPIRIGVSVVCSVFAWQAVRRDCLRSGPFAVRALSWDGQGRFRVELVSGVIVPAKLGPGSLQVGPFLWLVLWGRRRHPVFIDRRSLQPGPAAALLRALKTGRPAAGGPALD
ncbi:MAG: hypothetical protein RLZZ393_313 [Pseudomonadota bacterium]